ncbi:hypothetical protein KC345_g9939 [Hortaea werneckii]|nr:hypothetical protein KC345_g9939 [Hortaea werneckii]
MGEITKNEHQFIGYEYKDITVKRSMETVYTDGYPYFGWALEGTSTPFQNTGSVILKFKRDRKIRNKVELTRLQRQFEACASEIGHLEGSKAIGASVWAYTIGLIGTAFMAGSVFANQDDRLVLSIILAVPGFIGWIIPYFSYREIHKKTTGKATPLIDQKYDEIYEHRTAVVNTVSLSFNALIGAFKLILGVYLLSGWFMTNAVYYLILSAARGQALHKYAAANQIGPPADRFHMEYAVYKRSGVLLSLLGISYLLISVRMYLSGDAVVFGGNLVFLIAAVSFTKLGIAIYGIAANRHLKGPIVSTLKIFSFSDAMVSIVVTQYTLLTMEQSPNALESSSLFGMGCSLLFMITGIYMVRKKKKPPNPEACPDSCGE